MHPSQTPRPTARKGISLLETMVASAVMFISMAAINQLLDSSGQQARAVRNRSLAAQACHAKLNEFACGSLGFSSQSGQFDNDMLPGWEWSIDSEQYQVQGLWKVTVHVKKTDSDDPSDDAVLEQFVLDSSVRGSPLDQAPPTGASSSSSSSSSSGSTGQTTTPTTGGGMGGGMGGGTGGGTGGAKGGAKSGP
jgi:Tfp pilus assembly protein PilV